MWFRNSTNFLFRFVSLNRDIKEEFGCQIKFQKQTKSASAFIFSLVYLFSKWSIICFLLKGHITIFATLVIIYLSSWTSDHSQFGRTSFKLKVNLKGSEGGDGQHPWEKYFLGETKIRKYIIGIQNGAARFNSLNTGSDGIICLCFS